MWALAGRRPEQFWEGGSSREAEVLGSELGCEGEVVRTLAALWLMACKLRRRADGRSEERQDVPEPEA